MNEKINYLNTRQVSKFLGLSLRTVQYLSKLGRITSFKIGGQWRYPRKTLEQYSPKAIINDQKNLLTAKQVSEYLCISLRTIHRLSQQGKIKSFKIGRQWRYIKKDIDKYCMEDNDFSKEPARRPNNSTDQRIYPRINCNLPCHIKALIPLKKEISTNTRIVNIGEGGIFIENSFNEEEFLKIRTDDPIELMFELDKAVKIHTDGRVLRVQDKGIAVKFKRINSETKELIRGYVG